MVVGPFTFGVLLICAILVALVLGLALFRQIPGLRRSHRNDGTYFGEERRKCPEKTYLVVDEGDKIKQ